MKSDLLRPAMGAVLVLLAGFAESAPPSLDEEPRGGAGTCAGCCDHREVRLGVSSADGVVSVDACNAPLDELLREIALRCGLDLQLEAALDVRVDLRLDGLSLEDALDRILGRGYVYIFASRSGEKGEGGRTLWVFPSRTGEDRGGPPSAVAPQTEAYRRLEKLVAALADPHETVRLEAVNDLPDFGRAASFALADAALFDAEPAVREEAIMGLGEVGAEADLPTLERVLLDPDESVREAAVWAAVDIGGEEAAWALSMALGDEDASLREEVVYALGEIGGESAFHLLERALADEDDGVRDAAAETIEEIAPRRMRRMRRAQQKPAED